VEELSHEVTYREPLLLFHNEGRAFKTVSEQSGPVSCDVVRRRGLAVGVINNDRVLEVLISVNDGAPVLLRNNIGKQSHWLGVNLIGRKSNPDTIGAHVTYQAGDQARG